MWWNALSYLFNLLNILDLIFDCRFLLFVLSVRFLVAIIKFDMWLVSCYALSMADRETVIGSTGTPIHSYFTCERMF